MPSGIVILVKDSQDLKASSPILLTLSGISILVKPLHSKVPVLISVMPSGRVISDNFVQYIKAYSPISLTLLGMVISSTSSQ